jgi:hypothetical protein
MARAPHRPAARRQWAALLAALALGMPTAAYPISLAHLLQLPLEQLLRLEITSPAVARGAPHGR